MPSATPSDVSDDDPLDALTALATPKSVTTAWPSDSSTLSGLMSRWTTPFRWAKESASTISRRILAASATGSSPSRASLLRSDSPWINGMT